MPSKMTFQGVQLLKFGRNNKGGTAQFSSTYTENVANAMEWPVLVPEIYMTTKPEGALICASLQLIPTQKDMGKFTVDFGVCQVSKFQFVRRELEEQRGKGHRQELRFEVQFTDTEGCRRLEQYMLTIGEKKGRVTVSYDKQAKQDELLMGEESAPVRPITDEDTPDIPAIQ